MSCWVVCYLPPITICIERRAGLVAKAGTVDSEDMVPCHNCAKVLICVVLLCFGLGGFCDKSFNLCFSSPAIKWE